METFSHETLDPIWVTGFSDAQARFTFSRSGRQLALYFSLRLPQTDRVVLEAIQRFFGVGTIYPAKPRSLLYRVTHREDLQRVIAHFDQHPLQTSKQADYVVWREMVSTKQAFRRPDRLALDALARRLSRR